MLAIVIPYYKFLFFEKTLQSLSDQTDKRFKVYIGNDASNSNPDELIQKYSKDFPIFYEKFENNLGGLSLVNQWNRCLQLINDEEWLMILGDDDVLGDNVVSTFYQELEEIKLVSNVVRFSTVKINETGKITSKLYQNEKIESSIDFLLNGTRSSLSEYIFNRNTVFQIGFKNFPLAWYSDVLAVLEFSNFKEIYSINNAVVQIRISDNSISGSSDNFLLKSKATLQFYDYLLSQKTNFFSKSQKIVLLDKISKSYLNNKKEISFFFKITKLHIQMLQLQKYLTFLKKIKAF